MDTRVMKITSVNLAPYNPRDDLKPGDQEYQDLKASLEQFGLVEPLVWNERTGHLVGGHQRLKVWAALGHQDAPFSVVDLDDDQERQLNLALNHLSGRWNDKKLTDLIAGLAGKRVDLRVAGFSQTDVQTFLQKHSAQHASDFLAPMLSAALADPLAALAKPARPASTDTVEASPAETAPAQEYYPLSFSVTAAERGTVHQALALAKARTGATTQQEALLAICAEYLQGAQP